MGTRESACTNTVIERHQSHEERLAILTFVTLCQVHCRVARSSALDLLCDYEVQLGGKQA
jgi:hypothetical protein